MIGQEIENTTGRIDTLILRGMQMAVDALDGHAGTSGSWEKLGGVVQLAVDEYVPKTRLEIPKEARVVAALLGIK